VKLEVPPARGSVPFDELRDHDFDVLLPAQKSPVYGHLFSEALACIRRHGRRRDSLDSILASSAALQIGLLVLVNERANPVVPPEQIAATARQILESVVSSSESSTSLRLEIESDRNRAVHSSQITREHYGRLFGALDKDEYFTTAERLLNARLTRNGITPDDVRYCRILDAGCGGGRYSCALAAFGAQHVVGVDLSETNIETAARWHKESGYRERLQFEVGSLEALRFADATFDVVFCNGVVHHMANPEAGIAELMRVLKPGGWGFFKVMPNPGGLHWDLIELARLLLWEVSLQGPHQLFAEAGLTPALRYYLLDHMLVPFNTRFTRSEVRYLLAAHGACDIRFLERGADVDRVERIYRGEPETSIRFGDGEARYVFRKNA
jgi:2-polyprenyl-3-methyl-5-hydroxy-6-metoxy-1,4-benzoquinol methylase